MEKVPSITDTRDLGIMLYDMDFSNSDDIIPRFFRAKIENGVLIVPPLIVRDIKMILKALYDYYHRCGDLAPEGFEYKEIPFVIVLDESEKVINVEDRRIDKNEARHFWS